MVVDRVQIPCGTPGFEWTRAGDNSDDDCELFDLRVDSSGPFECPQKSWQPNGVRQQETDHIVAHRDTLTITVVPRIVRGTPIMKGVKTSGDSEVAVVLYLQLRLLLWRRQTMVTSW